MTNYLILKMFEYKPFLDPFKGIFDFFENNKKDKIVKNIIDDSLKYTSDNLIKINQILKLQLTTQNVKDLMEEKSKIETRAQCGI